MCGGMGGGGVLLLFNDDDGDGETGDDCCVCCCCCCCLMMEGLRVVLRCCCCCCWLDILILSVTSLRLPPPTFWYVPKFDLSDACVVVFVLLDDFLFVFAVGCFLLDFWGVMISFRFVSTCGMEEFNLSACARNGRR